MASRGKPTVTQSVKTVDDALVPGGRYVTVGGAIPRLLQAFGVVIRILSYDDLIKNKETLGRAVDKQDVEELRRRRRLN